MRISDESFIWFLRGMALRNKEFRFEYSGDRYLVHIPVASVVKGLMDKYSVSRATAYRWINFHLSRSGFWVRSSSLRLAQRGRGFVLSGVFKT